MGTRVSYPLEVKQATIKMKLEGKSTKEIMEKLSIKNKTQIQTWWRWYLNGEEHRFTYGYRRITEVIRRTQIINKNTVHKICDNVLNRNFKSEERFKKLVTYITYLPFGSKMMYLSSIMDLYNGEIVAYSISDK